MSKYGNKFERGLEDSFRAATPGNKKKFPDYPKSKPRMSFNPQKPLIKGSGGNIPTFFFYKPSINQLEEKMVQYEIKLKEILPDILKEMGLEKAPKILFQYDLGNSAGYFQYPAEGTLFFDPIIRISINSIENPSSFLLNIMNIKKEYALHGILIHELQHWKQWLSKRMSTTIRGESVWEGKIYTQFHEWFHEYPWEVEANDTVRKVMAALYPEPIKLQEYKVPEPGTDQEHSRSPRVYLVHLQSPCWYKIQILV